MYKKIHVCNICQCECEPYLTCGTHVLLSFFLNKKALVGIDTVASIGMVALQY